MHRPPLDSFRQLNLLRHLSAGFTGLHTEFGLCMPEYQGRRFRSTTDQSRRLSVCMPEYQGRRFRALLLHSTSRIISSQNLLKQRCAPPFQRRTSRTIIVHALGKIDRVHHLNAVAEMPQHPAALDDQTAFRNLQVGIEKKFIFFHSVTSSGSLRIRRTTLSVKVSLLVWLKWT